MQKRLKHPIYGYELFPKVAYSEQIKWLKNNYDVHFDINDVYYSPSIIASMNICIETFTNIGDNIIVQTPIYSPFFNSVKNLERNVLYNPLIKDENGLYKMDLENLKKQINKNTKLLLLCNPHNPTGRAFNKKELEDLLDICIKNNILVFSDEIHCDLVYKPYKHIPFASLKGAKDITISTYSIGKSFNLSGLAISTIYIQNEQLKDKFIKTYNKYNFGSGNILGHTAFKTAYKDGFNWLEDLKEHLYNNYLLLKDICNKHQKHLTLMPIQATYLAWIDCSNMNMNDTQLNDFFIKKAKLGLNTGISFGENGTLHMRLNFAISSTKMKQIVKQLDNALNEL
jgi:cystathionine beta-lyase